MRLRRYATLLIRRVSSGEVDTGSPSKMRCFEAMAASTSVEAAREVTSMRILMLLAFLMATSAASAAPAKTAVFDLELADLSIEAARGVREDQTHRLELASAELRELLKASPQLQLVDLTPKLDEIRRDAPLYKCNGCEEDIARQLGAELAVTGVVQKTSNLILSIIVTVKDVRSGRVIRAGQVDLRGNTDETWLRGVRWIVKNRILAEPLPIPS
jgi:hypothetical protein